MALFTPSESPAVVVKEVDLTGGVPNVQSTTGAFVGNFRWGPVEQRTLITNEQGLVDVHASPDTSNNRNIDFVSATQFLRYSNSLQVVRAIDGTAKNARAQTPASSLPVWNGIGDSVGGAGALRVFNTTSFTVPNGTNKDSVGGNFVLQNSITVPVIKNKTNFEAQEATLGTTATNVQDTTGYHTFVSRFPGALGNSLRVSVCPPNHLMSFDSTTGDSGKPFNTWAYKSSFDAAPGTSSSASAQSGARDEIHVVVIDQNGTLTGTAGTILETYPHVSVATNAKNIEGGTNYAKDVINERSEYIHMLNFDSNYRVENAGTALTPGVAKTFLDSQQVATFDFDSGVDAGTLSAANIQTGFDQFEDKDAVEVDFLIAPGMATRTEQTTVVNDLVGTARSLRKDCVVVTSPSRADVVNVTNAATATTNITTTAATFTNTSYLVMDGNYLKVYDKFNDVYVQVPAASSTAGIMAATDNERAPWFSPAGARRGQYFGITAIDYTPTKSQRDTLYKAGVNPVANIPGTGVVLFGDKTKLNRPSAFDRINVRRLFLVLERAIARAAESVLFEFNDEFTRAEFVNIVEPVLREVKGRRGITDFRVVCDETNNTAAVVDRNEFLASIFIKPARSINYVTLNFVAVRTGVDFEEVVGTV